MKFQKGQKGYWLGKTMSKEHRLKMSNSSPIKGKTRSEETKSKISKARKLQIN